MCEQIEGSQAIAKTIAACRPEVVAAYPISPQTHIAETLSAFVKEGKIEGCEYLNVEFEFGAMSACIGASTVGVRIYTAAVSQGLLLMVEAVYNVSGLGLPIVMTVANRAIGAPTNIWNDHTDAMSQRDSGWLQLYVETNQEAADLHAQAFRIVEELSLPAMVCMNGLIPAHAMEIVSVPEAEDVACFLPLYEPRQVFSPANPVSIGAMVGPKAYTEVRYLVHHRQTQALELISKVQKKSAEVFGRDSGGLARPYRIEDADTIIVSMGSVLRTIKDVVDECRERREKIGVLGITSFCPFPTEAVRDALKDCRCFTNTEKAFSVGIDGIVSSYCRGAVRGMGIENFEVFAGFSGHPITKVPLHGLLDASAQNTLEVQTFLDLDHELVDAELTREAVSHLSDPLAENIVRDSYARSDAALAHEAGN